MVLVLVMVMISVSSIHSAALRIYSLLVACTSSQLHQHGSDLVSRLVTLIFGKQGVQGPPRWPLRYCATFSALLAQSQSASTLAISSPATTRRDSIAGAARFRGDIRRAGFVPARAQSGVIQTWDRTTDHVVAVTKPGSSVLSGIDDKLGLAAGRDEASIRSIHTVSEARNSSGLAMNQPASNYACEQVKRMARYCRLGDTEHLSPRQSSCFAQLTASHRILGNREGPGSGARARGGE